MKIFVITDTHFGHKKLSDEWKTRHEGFGEEILENVSKQNGDLLIHLGDVCIGKDAELIPPFIEAAKHFTKKILVRGNHDNKSYAWYQNIGFDFVCEDFTAKYFGKNILFTHAPVCSRSTKRGYDFNVHGHLHGTAEESHHQVYGVYDDTFNLDMAPELRGYKAHNLEAIIKQQELCQTEAQK